MGVAQHGESTPRYYANSQVMCILPEKFLLKNLNPGKLKGFANVTLVYFLHFENSGPFSYIFLEKEGAGKASGAGGGGRAQSKIRVGRGE